MAPTIGIRGKSGDDSPTGLEASSKSSPENKFSKLWYEHEHYNLLLSPSTPPPSPNMAGKLYSTHEKDLGRQTLSTEFF